MTYPIISGGIIQDTNVNETTITISETRTLQDKLSDIVSVKDFGAIGDGVTDDTAAFNNALKNFDTIYIPNGVYCFSSTLELTNNKTLIGESQYGVILLYIGIDTDINLIEIHGTSSSILSKYSLLKNISIESKMKMTSKSAISIEFNGFSKLLNISISPQYSNNRGNLYNGITYHQTDYQIIDGFEINYCNNNGIQIYGDGISSSGPQYDLFISTGKIASCQNNGILIGGGFDNIVFNNIICTTNSTNVTIDNSLSQHVNQNIFFNSNFICEWSTTGSGFYINDTQSGVPSSNIVIEGHIQNNNKNGITIKTYNNGHIEIKSPHISSNGEEGIQIQDNSAIITISDTTQIYNNGSYGINADFDGCWVKTNAYIYNNTSGPYNKNIYIGEKNSIGNITPSGTTNTTATEVNSRYSILVNGVVNSGVILNGNVGEERIIYNTCGVDINIYPDIDTQILSQDQNTPYVIKTGDILNLLKVSKNVWFLTK